MPIQKPTSELASQYIKQIVGKTPMTKEIKNLIANWTKYPDVFQKDLAKIKLASAKLGNPSPALDAELKAAKKAAPPTDTEILKLRKPFQNAWAAVNGADINDEQWLDMVSTLKNDPNIVFKIKEVIYNLKAEATANAKKNAKKATAKEPTIASQVAAIAKQTEPQATENEPFNDIEVQGLMGAVKQELKKKFNPDSKGSWTDPYKKYKSAFNQVVKKARTVQNKTGFLLGVVKMLNPSYKPGAGKITAKPGEFHTMQMPNEPLSPFAQTMGMSPEKKAKAVELKAKIAEYEAVLKKLKDEQKKAAAGLDKAKLDQDKLGGINEKLLKYFSYIEKNCSQYLAAVKEANGKLLFRGQDDASQPIFVAYPRPDREPKDSDLEAQKLIDQYLSSQGFKALRGNSLFTVADMHHAGNYGTVYAIFPKNGFSFTWSTKHDDLVIYSINEVDDDASDTEDTLHEYEEWYDEFNNYTGDIDMFMDDNPEKFGLGNIDNDDQFYKQAGILEKKIIKLPEYKKFKVAFNKYDNIDMYDDSPADVHKAFIAMAETFAAFMSKTGLKLLSTNELKQLTKKVESAKKHLGPTDSAGMKKKALAAIKSFGFTKENFPSALKSGHEVMITGEYIAVDYERFEKEVDQYFIKPNKAAKAKKK